MRKSRTIKLLGISNNMSIGPVIFKGMKIGVLPDDLSFVLDADQDESRHLIISTSYNVIPIWIKAAHEHMKLSYKANENLLKNWNEDPDNQKQLLTAELIPSIQVFVSCGIAIDSLYDLLRPFSKLTEQDIATWKRKKTKRSAQIVEVIRRVYNLKKEDLKKFQLNISEIIQWRDWAVHPSNEIRNTITRSDLNVGVDWKFGAYRYTNSERCFTSTVQMLIWLLEQPNKNLDVAYEIEFIFESLKELGVIQVNT